MKMSGHPPSYKKFRITLRPSSFFLMPYAKANMIKFLFVKSPKIYGKAYLVCMKAVVQIKKRKPLTLF